MFSKLYDFTQQVCKYIVRFGWKSYPVLEFYIQYYMYAYTRYLHKPIMKIIYQNIPKWY